MRRISNSIIKQRLKFWIPILDLKHVRQRKDGWFKPILYFYNLKFSPVKHFSFSSIYFLHIINNFFLSFQLYMNAKRTATVDEILFVSTMSAKTLMNVCREEDLVLWVLYVLTCQVDINAAVQRVWTGIRIIKDVSDRILS